MNERYEYVDETSLDTELICNICHAPFNDPYCTPCGETFCLGCILQWIQGGYGHCPHCRQIISDEVLTQAPRSMRNMLDRLPVRCKACKQSAILRASFDDHIKKICLKTTVSCSSADIRCPWVGQREQLNGHLATCYFEPMRPFITQFIAENKQLKDLVNQQATQISEQQHENQRMKEQMTLLLAQNTVRIDNKGVEELKGTWCYVDGENFDEYMKELGASLTVRRTANGLKPRLIISENHGIWTLRTEISYKITSYNFIPGVEFDGKSLTGETVKTIINFEGNKWVHTTVDNHGKKSIVTRYVDDKGQHMIDIECGPVKARRWYKRVK